MWDTTINQLRDNAAAKTMVQAKKVQNFAFGLDDKKISEEEDKILYEHYKKSVLARSFGNTFENYKNSRVSFPPNDAPGIVRRIWREMSEKATPEQKIQMFNLDHIYNHFMMDNKDYKRDMPNDIYGYMQLLKDLDKFCYTNYYKAPEIPDGFCQGISNVITNIENDIKKYV